MTGGAPLAEYLEEERWLDVLILCCWSDNCLSSIAKFSPVFWSLDVHSSLDDLPECLILLLRLSVARARVRLLTLPPDGDSFTISCLSSLMAFSATLFLLTFLACPT
jgi:hypothetical protein